MREDASVDIVLRPLSGFFCAPMDVGCGILRDCRAPVTTFFLAIVEGTSVIDEESVFERVGRQRNDGSKVGQLGRLPHPVIADGSND